MSASPSPSPVVDLAALRNLLVQGMLRVRNDGIQETCPIGIIDFEKWEWPQGVGLYGLWKVYDQTRDPALLERLHGWYHRRLAEGLPPRNVNTTAPMLTLAYVAEATGETVWLARCQEWAEWILREFPRTTAGGFQHIVSGQDNPEQLWDDTLFMTVLFLARMGVVLGRRDMVEEAEYQFLVHIAHLYDRTTGLWFHGWTFHGCHNFAQARWARGNCWITACTYDFFEIVGLQGATKRYLAQTVEAQVKALKKYQNANGMWHTLVVDPNSYVETSATAGFAYGILKGVRLGYLDPSYAEVGKKALAAVLSRIDKEGNVAEVSYGTGMGRDLDFYRKIPICQMAYGQALSLLLLCEALKAK